MRYVVAMFVVLGVPPLLTGCGGGLSQEDMRRHAIRRPSENDSNPDANASKPPAGNAKNETKDKIAVAKSPNATASAKLATDDGMAKNVDLRPNSNSSESSSDNASPKSLGSATAPPPPPLAELDKPLGRTARRQRTIDNLNRLGDALRRYTDENGRLFARAICDPKGQPLLSWRVELLPYLGHKELYDKFDMTEPWDGAHNKPLVKLMPDAYRSPERFDEKTNYLVPVASFTAFGRARGIGLRSVEDGMENTVIVLEVDDSAAIPWTQPVDFSLNLTTFDAQVGSLREDGFFVIWGDGSVTRVTAQRSAADLKAIFSFDGGDMFTSHLVRALPNANSTLEVVKSDVILSPERHAASAAAVGAIAPAAASRRGVPSAKPPSRERMPIPIARELARARQLVREIYEDEYEDARTVRGQQALAQEMLKHVPDMPEDPAGQYVMLDIVIQIATATNDSRTAIAALEEMQTHFEVDELKIEHNILEQLARKRDRGRAVNQALLDQAAPLIKRALKDEKFDTAESLCQIALGAARQLDNDEEEANWKRQKKLVEEARTAYRTIHRTIADLEDADDPNVNLDVGRYYCLIQGNWEKGLPMLAKGSDPMLKRLALAELRGPAEPKDRMELADGWWQRGSEKPTRQKVLRLRAVYWYLRALESLPQGLLRLKAELRVKQAERDYGTDMVTSLITFK